MKRTETPIPSFWRMLVLLVLAAGMALIAWLLFNPNRTRALGATELPIAMHSGLTANYSADLRAYVVPAVRLDLVEEALSDAAAREEQVDEVLQNLQTPVPTVTPQVVIILPTATPNNTDDDEKPQPPSEPTSTSPVIPTTVAATHTPVAASATPLPTRTSTAVNKPTATHVSPSNTVAAPTATSIPPTATSWPTLDLNWPPRKTQQWRKTNTPLPSATPQPPAPTAAPTSAPPAATSAPPAATSAPVQPTAEAPQPTIQPTFSLPKKPRWWPTSSSFLFPLPDERAEAGATLPVPITGTQTPRQTPLWQGIESLWQQILSWFSQK